jgi:hypothetical protein
LAQTQTGFFSHSFQMCVATPIREEILTVDSAEFANGGVPVFFADSAIFIAMAVVQSIAHDSLQSQVRKRLGRAGQLPNPHSDHGSGQKEPQSQHIIGSLP